MANEKRRRRPQPGQTEGTSRGRSDGKKFDRDEAARQKMAARQQRSHLKRDSKKREGDDKK